MSTNVYIVASRLRLAEEWIYQNEKFLKDHLKLEYRPHLLSTDGWRGMELLQGFPADCLMIMVELPSRYLRTVKQMFPHYVFISVDLD